jgi:hypothetical protein
MHSVALIQKNYARLTPVFSGVFFVFSECAALSEKRWVFRELVSNNQDYLGLMAYALYKHEKDETANGLRAEGKQDADVETALRAFHDQVLMSPARLESYKKQAASLVDVAIQRSTNAVEAAYQNKQRELESDYNKKQTELENLKEKLEKEDSKKKQKLKTEIINDIKGCVSDYKKPHFTMRSLMWIWGGFSGVIASVSVMVITFLILAIFSDPNSKHQIVANFFQNLLRLLTGESVG